METQHKDSDDEHGKKTEIQMWQPISMMRLYGTNSCDPPSLGLSFLLAISDDLTTCTHIDLGIGKKQERQDGGYGFASWEYHDDSCSSQP